MKFAILGSGFGLYGYLPALTVGCGQSVCLPERYRARLEGRNDVRHLGDLVEWVHDDNEALERADAVVIIKRPADQVKWIRDCTERTNIRALLLEKPLAPTPGLAIDVLDRLDASGKRYRIGYNFRFSPWVAILGTQLRTASASRPISVIWQLHAHHYANDIGNWKRFVSAGGGALRFFGIHLVGLLAELGYNDVIRSSFTALRPDECETWSATLLGAGLPECHVQVQTNAGQQRFSVSRIDEISKAGYFIDLRDPFEGSVPVEGYDRRVGVLIELCKDLIHGISANYPWYRQSVTLWDKIERCSRQDSMSK